MNIFVHQFLQAGFSVIPLEIRSKVPLVKWSNYQNHQVDTELADHWFSLPTNLGIITGFNNLTVIDFDDFAEYAKWLLWIGKLPIYPLIKRAFTVRSSRGVHIYFRTAQAERNRHLGKIDIKGRFGLITGPGSMHASGAIYTALNEFFIPTIGALSDVLPASLLLSKQDIGPVIDPPMPAPVVDDPWASANQTMSYAPGEDLIQRIRGTLKIEQFFKTPLTKTGAYFYTTLCPFHEDEKDSFWIDGKHQICGCFVCNFGKPLDVINFYGALYGLSNLEAIWTMSKMV